MCRVTMGHLRVTIGHLRVTVGHPRVAIGHIILQGVPQLSSHFVLLVFSVHPES